MKKSLIAMAILAAAGVASAQSSVTLFGIVDATVAHGSGSVANKTQLANSGLNSSRLGFRGTEDLGGGMSASFWLEAGVNNDNGSMGATNTNNQATGASGSGGLTFNRRSTVSLSGGFGEVRLGRDYTTQFWNLTVYDPFGTNGVGTTQTLNSSLGGPVTVRASNNIGYLTPSFGGFKVWAQYYLGENLSNAGATKNDGRGYGVRASYDNGPISVALATSRTDYATGNISTTNLGGSYSFGVGSVIAHYNRDRVAAPTDVTGRGWLVGGLIKAGPGNIRLAYSTYKTNAVNDPKTNKYALGYVYDMSKRTSLYTTVARVTNSGGAAQSLNGAVTAANDSSTGFDIGIKHSF